MKNVLELLAGKNISSKKASSHKGGEYHSACPGCGGDDRFHVWPEQNKGAGSYWCRQCGKAGDAIQFLRDFDGLSYQAACRALDVDLPEREQFRTPRVKSQKGGGAPASWQAAESPRPVDLWQEKADKLVGWAHGKLIENKSQMRWLLGRGITKKLVVAHQLGWIDEDMWRHRKTWGLPAVLKKDGKAKKLWIQGGLVIPKMIDGHAVRIRIRRPAGEPRFYALPGSNMDSLMLSERARDRLAVVVEAELDAILISRFAADLALIIALGNSSRKPDIEAHNRLAAADCVLVSLDYDDGGNRQWAWWRHYLPRSKHWPVPAGKDPTDAFKQGFDLRAWVVAGCPKGWRISQSLRGARPGPTAEKIEAVMPTAAVGESDIPRGVLMLRDLLKGTPVFVENTESRTVVRCPRRWSDENWDKSKKISDLVYFDEDVFDWITSHPDLKIRANNIIKNKLTKK